MCNSLEYLDIDRLALILGISAQALYDLSTNAQQHYKVIPHKKGEKRRIIEIPSDTLKKVQKVLLKKVLGRLSVHPQLFALPGTSIKHAVKQHVKKPLVVTMDIKDFFPNIKRHQITKALMARKAKREVADIIVNLTTYRGHLPHGSPTSPCLARLVISPIAKHIEKAISKIPNADFSIYVDDIILSGPVGLKRTIGTIKKIIERYGLRLNESKLHMVVYSEVRNLQ